MKKLVISGCFALLFSFTLTAQLKQEEQWPQFRGPGALGYKPDSKLPVSWNTATGENVAWKTYIPGLGHSCPVIWGDQLFVTTAISGSGNDSLKVGLYGDIDEVKDQSIHEFRVYCLHKKTGKIIWERLAHKGIPLTKRHTKSSHANCTPATDGKYLVVFFGSEGLFCYDLDGTLIWKKDLGKMNAGPYTDPGVEWGFASSPVLHNGTVIVQCDFIGNSFLAAFDVKNGSEIWRTPRDEVSTWSTPAIVESNGQTQVVVNGFKHMGGYDFETGKELWKMSGGGDAPVPTPVFANGLIYINNAHGKWSPIYAVDPAARGDITLGETETANRFVTLSIKRGGAYMQTPLIIDSLLYNLQWNGQLTVFESRTGKLIYRQTMVASGGYTASPVAGDGKVYCCSEKGDVFIIASGNEYKMLAHNQLNDLVMATPAISENDLYFRTQHYLIAIREK